MYGYPAEAIYDVGNSSSHMTSYAERQMPIFQESSALYPSIYLPSGAQVYPWMDTVYYRQWVTSIVQQTVLLSKAVGAGAATVDTAGRAGLDGARAVRQRPRYQRHGLR